MSSSYLSKSQKTKQKVNSAEKGIQEVNQQFQVESQNPIHQEELSIANLVQRQENQTGLPDNLKVGIESLSGYSMDDVKVHYNSFKPSQLNAHAYAQGNQIHLASGQEKYLPHEAWHVVQQKQGRVKPTMSFDGALINDDQGLEKEADVMGYRALQLRKKNDINGTIKNELRDSAVKQKKSNVFQLISEGDYNAWVRAKIISLFRGAPRMAMKAADASLRDFIGARLETLGLILDDVNEVQLNEFLRLFTFEDPRFGAQPADNAHEVEQGWEGTHTDVSPDDAAYTVGLGPCVALGLILVKDGRTRVSLGHFDSGTNVAASIVQMLNHIGAEEEDHVRVRAFLAGGIGEPGAELFDAMDEGLQTLGVEFIERHRSVADVMDVQMSANGMSRFRQR